MYLIREADIIHFATYNQLKFLQCACKFTKKQSAHGEEGMRKFTKNLISNLKQTNPLVESNIFKSVENVNLNTLISYKDKRGKLHNFNENFKK